MVNQRERWIVILGVTWFCWTSAKNI